MANALTALFSTGPDIDNPEDVIANSLNSKEYKEADSRCNNLWKKIVSVTSGKDKKDKLEKMINTLTGKTRQDNKEIAQIKNTKTVDKEIGE